MFFSKTCEYAFRAVVEIALASSQGRRLTLTMIAKQTEAPEAFTAKVLQTLSKAGVLISHRGPHGGFDLPPERARQVNLHMVMQAIGEDVDRKACVMGLRQCGVDEPCPMHGQFEGMKNRMVQILESTYIDDVVRGLRMGDTAGRGGFFQGHD